MNDLYYRLALHRAPGVGPSKYKKLVEHFGSAEDVFVAKSDELRELGMSQPHSLRYFQQPNWRNVDHDLAWEKRTNHHILTWDHPEYPKLLREIPGDGPPLLFVAGNLSLLNSPQIAVVGSRQPTPTGREIAHELSKTLSNRSFTITSGLALGIDAASHRGALAGSGLTLAVAATGLDRVYPLRHRQLAVDILLNNGAIVSEFPIGTAPLREHFPRRNRLISGLSLGTLVVEAATKSGSLITARLAAEQGREVFAIPGSIRNPVTGGCHLLLREGAKLVETADDIIEELGAMVKLLSPNKKQEPQLILQQVKLSEKNNLVFNQLGYEPTPVDTLIGRTGLTAETVSSILVELELQGYVTAMSGGLYIRQTLRGTK